MRWLVAAVFVVVPLSGFVQSVAAGGWRVLDCLALAFLAFLLLNVGAAIAGGCQHGER